MSLSRGKLKVHSKRVKVIKKVLPIFAFSMLVMVCVFPLINENKEAVILAFRPLDMKGAEVTMSNIRFLASDDKEQPIYVSTESVKELDKSKKIYKLINPSMAYRFEQQGSLKGKTTYALAYQNQEAVFFDEPLVLTSEDGAVAKVEKVMCKYHTGTAASNKRVVVNSSSGNLDSEGFFIYNRGKNIDLKNKTQLEIFDEKGNIYISSSEGAFIDTVLRKIVFNKNVVVKQHDKRLFSDVMHVFYKKNPQTGKNELDKIEAFGNVHLVSQESDIIGNQGIYNHETKIASIFDNVVLKRGGSHIKTEKVDMNLETGKVKLYTYENNSKNKRIKGQLNPKDLNK